MKIFFRINQQKGLTLVEVIIATVIFTLIATILVDTFSQGYQQLRRDRMRIIAYFLAQERMEELLTFAEVFPNPQLRNETRQQVNNFTQFERQVNFTCPPTGLNADYNNLTLINVTVFWNASGRQRQFSLLSMVANFSN